MGVFDFAKHMTRAAVRTAVLPIDIAKDTAEFFDPDNLTFTEKKSNTSKGIDSIKDQIDEAIDKLEED